MSIAGNMKIAKTLGERLDVQNSLLAAIASNTGGVQVTSWADLQRIVRLGLANKVFAAGDQLVSNFDDSAVIWDIIGIDHDEPAGDNFSHSLTLQMHDCLRDAVFSAPQALWFAEAGLSPGTHRFTLNDVKYQFTTTESIPEGGVVYCDKWEADGYVPTQIATYSEDRETLIEGNLVVAVAASGADTLTPVNHHQRCRYGSNNYFESGIRQWLNSEDSVFKWKPQTNFDRPSSYTTGGFLHHLDPELAAVIGPVKKQVARNTVTDTERDQDLFSDKIFLLSRLEVDFDNEGVTTGEKVYDYYKGLSNEAKIKLLSGSARHWWLRSPHTGYSYYARCAFSSGALNYHYALTALGAAPACCIW